MSQQIQITGGAKVRNLEGVLTGTSGVVNSLGINVPSGIPQLDGSGKILVSQLPNSVMEYKGSWNAATNTPTLADGTGNAGDVYLCNVAGTVNFGSGPIVFYVGDQVIYSGTIWQRASGATGTVSSVAVTESGDALTITGSPITTAGTINIGFAGNNTQYINGAGGLTTFPSLSGYLTAVTATAPLLSSGGTTPDLSIPAASASVDGYLDNADWTTFNNKQNAITLTTTGTTGAATLIGATLNIPNYSTDLSGYVPYTGATGNVNLGTHSLSAYDLIINHTSGSGVAASITKGGNGEALTVVKSSGSGNAASITGGVTLISELHLTTDLADAYIASAANWNTAYTNRITSATSPLNITSNVISISLANTTTSGYLSSTDWNTFNNKLGVGFDTYGTLYARTAVTTYRDHSTSAANDAPIKSLSNTEDNWIYCDAVNAQFGIYHRNIDTDLVVSGQPTLPGNSIAYIGNNLIASYVNLMNGNAYFRGSLTANSIIKNGGTASQFLKADGSVDSTSYQPILTNPVTGTGTNKYIPKFTGSTTIGDSSINDNGGYVAINGTAGSVYALDVYASNSTYNLRLYQPLTATTSYNTIYITGAMTTVAAYFGIGGSTTGNTSFRSAAVIGTQSAHPLVFNTSDTNQMRLFANGNLLIGTTTTDAGYKLDVVGTARVNGRLTITDNGTNFPILVNNQTTQQYVSIESGAGFEAMTRYYNPTALSWYTGIRTTAGLGSNSSYHIYSDAYGDDVFAINTNGSAVFASSLTATFNAAYNDSDKVGLILRNASNILKRLDMGYDGTADISYIQSIHKGTTYKNLSLNAMGGFIGIGTPDPAYKLSVNTNADVWHVAIGSVSNTGKMIRIGGFGGGGAYGVIGAYSTFSNDSPIPLVFQREGSSVFIGTATGVTGGGALQVNGDVNINGNFKINGTTIGGGGGSGVTGSGTTNYIPKWSGGTSLGDSAMLQDSGGIQYFGGSSSSGTSTSTPKYFRFNNDYSSGYTDASLKLYIFNEAGTRQGITAGPNYDMQYHSSGSDVGRHSFYAQNTLSMTVGLNRVGVNINPTYTFQVYNNSDVWHTVIGGASGQLRIGAQTTAGAVIQSYTPAGVVRQLYIQRDGGNVILGGDTDNGYKLQVNGSVSSTGGYFDTSDKRLKTLITDNHQAKGIENVSAKLYVKNGKEELGYYAQDLQEILPSAVNEGSDGFLSLAYSQVHTAKIAYLEKEIAELKELIKTLL